MYLLAVELIRPYIEQDTDTGEVAEKLESEYKIVEDFYNKKKDDFEKQFFKYYNFNYSKNGDYKKSFDEAIQQITAWLRNEFLEYMKTDSTGYQTKASRMRGSPSFIDTGNYFSNLFFEIVK